MSKQEKTSDRSQKLLRGDYVPMPDYRYQSVSGRSGEISVKTGAEPVRRFEELRNFVLSN